MREVEAIKSISDALEKLDAEERSRVLIWVGLKYGHAPSLPSQSGVHQPASVSVNQAAPTKPIPKQKAPKKAKPVISMDKTLNLAPQGKPSAVQFAALKAPSTLQKKCVVAAYYLRDFVGVEKITAAAVLTFFKTVAWPAPSDLKNKLQQAGSSGWLDTADSDDVKITTSGENLVEHQLPAAT